MRSVRNRGLAMVLWIVAGVGYGYRCQGSCGIGEFLHGLDFPALHEWA